MREIWYGWLLRLIHINGASLFFIFLYFHLLRGIYFFRSTHKKVWLRGILLMLLLMGISFLGYVLPWGQISYWGVAVITNLLSVIPVVGDSLVQWVWGGFSVNSPTLIRFYSIHFILPLVIIIIVIIHLMRLHNQGSRNTIGVERNLDKLQFHPFFTTKDLRFFVAVFLIFRILFFYEPYLLRDPENNIPANFIKTPVHIQPEWYFLPYYAILRAFPRKTAGVVGFFISVISLSLLTLYRIKYSVKFSFYRKTTFWIFSFNLITLIKLGILPAEEPFVIISKLRTIIYFISLFTINL